MEEEKQKIQIKEDVVADTKEAVEKDMKDKEAKATPEVQKKEKKVKEKKRIDPEKKAKAVKTILILLLILLPILIGTAFVAGVYLYPKIGDWLNEKDISIEFFEKYRINEDTVKMPSGETVTERIIQVTSEESNIIEVVDENMPSIVSVAISEAIFSPTEGVVNQSSNIGSGFIVDSNGLIITNQHVVSLVQSEYKVITADGTEYDVKKIIRDDINDIALLEIEATGLNAVDLGDSDTLVPGQTVIAFGTPLGEFAGSVTTGVISGLERSVTTGSGSFFQTVKTFEDVIQTDAAINPGNSGGPLMNSVGEVIGINFATSAGADNISFALPINRVKARIDEYNKYGKFLRPYIGIEYQVISAVEARFIEGVEPGAFVRAVIDGGPADIAGIKQGDIITKIDDAEVNKSFAEMIQEYKIGDSVELEVLRDGEKITVEVTLGEAD